MPGLTTAFAQGVAASRPAAATTNAGYVYFATDTGILSQSTGSSWTTIGPAVALDALTAKGDVLTRSSSAYSRLGVGSDAQVLTADSTASTGLKWATPSSGFSDPTTTKGDLIVHGASTTRLGVGSDAQILTADSTQSAGVKWAAAASAGNWIKLAETIPGSAAANVDFTSISSSYRHLVVTWLVRSDNASAGCDVWCRLNGDTGANYTYQRHYTSTATAWSGDQAQGATKYNCGSAAAASMTANYASGGELWIFDYARTSWYKAMRGTYHFQNGTGANAVTAGVTAATWASTAAVNEVTILCSAGNLVANSVVTLWGVG